MRRGFWQGLKQVDLRVWAAVSWFAVLASVVAAVTGTAIDWILVGVTALFAGFVTWVAVDTERN